MTPADWIKQAKQAAAKVEFTGAAALLKPQLVVREMPARPVLDLDAIGRPVVRDTIDGATVRLRVEIAGRFLDCEMMLAGIYEDCNEPLDLQIQRFAAHALAKMVLDGVRLRP